MAVLTTSQLTFYDYKDAYSVEINPDCIVINCDEKGISKDITEVNISYSVYCGRSRISGTAVLNFEINGEKIEYTVQDCSSEVDGSIQFSIPANIDFTNIESAHIIFSELVGGDGDTFTFDKYVQFIKAVDGASGTGLVFKVYSENGTIFREDMEEIQLETVLFVGESRVELSDEDYTWEYDNGLNTWVQLGNGSTLLINRSDEYAFKTIRCVINYNENIYEDYISLTDDVVIYSSEIKYFNGSNVFGAKDKYLIAYMSLYKNGKEIDILPANQYAIATSISNSGVITTDVKKEDGTVFDANDTGVLIYFIVNDTSNANIYNIVLGQFNGTLWQLVDPSNVIDVPYECVYSSSKSYDNLAKASLYNESNKIMVVSKEQVNKTLPISFNAYKKTDIVSPVSTAIDSVIDTHDPIIGTNPPENPIDGTLWIDIGSSPYKLKVCQINSDGTVEWVDSNEYIGEKVHTSRPESYSILDIWILNDAETCAYIDKNGVHYEYGPGSMLRSSASRTKSEITEMNGYPYSDWSEIKSELTEMRDNVAQYFEFNSDTGLKIGQKDQKFYVNISATEMGFYDNSNSSDPDKKVVSIGNQSAKIKHLTVEEQTSFNCNCQADFNNQINMHRSSSNNAGFAWKIESNGSLSLVVLS